MLVPRGHCLLLFKERTHKRMVLEHWKWGGALSRFPSCAFTSIPPAGSVGPLQVVTYAELGVHIWLTTI